ncbi:MAG: hypothetical protein C0178_01685 [Sulfurihydrogenibium sp.]|nr:MAG: hypothetical protein C0178_01685 [Sulfurihydrogenibium sp.]
MLKFTIMKIKKILQNNYVKLTLKIFTEAFFILFFFTLIFLILLYLVSSYKDVLKKFGVYVQDDCKIQNGSVVCSFINLTDKKEYNVNLKNVYADVKLSNLLKFKSFVDLKVESLSGQYFNDLNAPPSEKFSFIFPLYLFTSYVNFDVKNVDFKVKNIEKDLDLDIKNLSIYNQQNIIFLNSKPDLTFLKEKTAYNLNILPLQGYQLKIFPKRIQVKNVKVVYQTITADVKNLLIFEDKSIELESKINSPTYTYNTITIYGLDGDLSLKKKKDTDIKLNATLKQLDYEKNLQLFNATVKTNLKLLEKEKKTIMKGHSEINVSSLKSPDIQLSDLFVSADMKDDNGFKVNGKYDIKVSQGSFDYVDKTKTLYLESHIPSLKKLLSVLPVKKDEILNSLDAQLDLKTDYFVDKKQANVKVDAKNFTALGLYYSNIFGTVDVFLKDYLLKANLQGLDKNQTVFINGDLKDFNDTKKLSFNFNVDAKNFVLQNLIFLKNVPIKSTLDAVGKIYGNLNDISMEFSGKATDFSYEEISLRNLLYNFQFKNKSIKLNAKDDKSSLTSDLSFDIPNENLDLKINLTKQFDLSLVYPFLLKQSKEVFEKVIPKSADGSVFLSLVKKDLNLKLDLKNVEAYLKDIDNTIYADVSGSITPKDTKIDLDFYKENLTIKDKTVKNINGKVNLVNKELNINAQVNGLNDFKSFKLSVNGNYNLQNQNFNLLSKLDLEDKNNLYADLNLKLNGSLNGYTGNLNGFVKNNKKFDFSFDIKGDQNKLLAYGKEIDFSEKNFKVVLGQSLITVNFDKTDLQKSSGTLIVKNLLVKEKDIPLITFSDLKVNYYDKKVYTDKQVFTGAFIGTVDKFLYDIDKNYLELSVYGNLDRKYVSQIIQYVNVDGKLKFALAYKGNPQDILEKASFKLYGEDLRLRTPYITNILSFDKFDITLKNNLYIDIKGSTRSSYGESSLVINGVYNIKSKEGNVLVNTELLPVKYENIYNGVLSTKTDIKLVKDKIYIDSKTLTTGKVKIEPDYFSQKTQSVEKPPILKNIYLNLKLSTLSPVFIEGSWGRVYGDGNFDVKGTAEKPLINGNFRVSYGKVEFLKTKYNVDFVDIKLSDSKTYVNGRLSTNVSGTYIYINVFGTANNLKYEFFSTPPKSKDEILTLLLIKKSPEQLASSGLFSVVGSVAKLFSPFKSSEEEEGLFGSGFNVNILPTYNPVQGITLNVYVQKYLTRRIYLAFSKPLSTSTTLTTNQYGFYEIGYRITERSSLSSRFYDNNTRSFEYTFTIPFDF